MSSAAEYNGQETAYPRQPVELPAGIDHGSLGLTKRELFAAMALQGMLANPDWMAVHTSYAQHAVDQADQLLFQLAKETPK